MYSINIKGNTSRTFFGAYFSVTLYTSQGTSRVLVVFFTFIAEIPL